MKPGEALPAWRVMIGFRTWVYVEARNVESAVETVERLMRPKPANVRDWKVERVPFPHVGQGQLPLLNAGILVREE